MGARPQAITKNEFRQVAALIYEQAGIALGAHKTDLVVARLGRRVRDLGAANIKEYLDWVLADDNGVELTHLVNALTTNTTDFYREEKHFGVLAQAAREMCAHGPPGRHGLRIWSAACSTGEEPYTIAMVLAETLGLGADFRVLASDIDTSVLKTASQGTYTAAAMKPVPPALRQRYFVPVTDGARQVARVVPALRQKVVFRQVNLIRDEFRFNRPLDFIFCRNVLIYFDQSGRQLVTQKLAEKLGPGGYLFVGHSETVNLERLSLRHLGNTVYQRRKESS